MWPTALGEVRPDAKQLCVLLLFLLPSTICIAVMLQPQDLTRVDLASGFRFIMASGRQPQIQPAASSDQIYLQASRRL